ncbi:MAG: acetyltransferase [Gammaproteobacteria bacterium]|nr:MAG: acetyltransferase [Gammaproteobacteria bacterium]
MYLKDRASGDLVEVLDLQALFDPFRDRVPGRFHAGEELQEPADFAKAALVFPSGEPLPRCWTDPDYPRK